MLELRDAMRARLARALANWAAALGAPSDAGAVLPTDADGNVPRHWLDAARPTPPQHWLDVVRAGAPQLLDGGDDGVIDWAADETAEEESLAQPLPTRERERPRSSVPQPVHPLRLSDVTISDPVAHPVKHVGSRAGGPLKLRVLSSDGEDSGDTRPVRHRLQAATLGDALAALPSPSRERPELDPWAYAASAAAQDTRRIESEGSPAPALQALRTMAGDTQGERGPLKPWQSIPRRAARILRRRLLRADFSPQAAIDRTHVTPLSTSHSERRREPPEPPEVRAAARKPVGMGVPVSVQSLPAAPNVPVAAHVRVTSTPLVTVASADFPPAHARVDSHHFPSLLADDDAPPAFDPREFERRRRLDAEQEGRLWNA